MKKARLKVDNELYELILEFCEVGKQIWKTKTKLFITIPFCMALLSLHRKPKAKKRYLKNPQNK